MNECKGGTLGAAFHPCLISLTGHRGWVSGYVVMKKLTIAVDGPAGAGKSTVARILAAKLCYTYIDTGAMYRAVTWAVMSHKLNVGDVEKVAQLAHTINLQLEYVHGFTRVTVDGTDVTEAIRTPEVSRIVSEVSAIAKVRAAMVCQQRQLAQRGGVVIEW